MSQFRKKKNIYYESTKRTNKMLADILPSVLRNLPESLSSSIISLKDEWNQIVGPKIGSMTSVYEMTPQKNIIIHVKNSTLLQLLVTQEKESITRKIHERFPQMGFKQILFKLG